METLNVNGIDIAYDRQGQGKPLVLIHGYPLDHTIWVDIVPPLSGTFDLILPDLRGFGASASSDRPATMADFAADIAGLLDGLRIPQAALVGHSMGGYVALAFARAYPMRMSGLGLVSSQVLADSPEGKEGRYKAAANVAEKGVGVVAEAMTPKLSTHARIQAIVHSLIEKQTPAGVIAALKAMAERADSTDLLPAMQYPIVLVHGEADALIPIDRARAVEAALLQSRMFALKNVGHLPMMESPQETADALKYLA